MWVQITLRARREAARWKLYCLKKLAVRSVKVSTRTGRHAVGIPRRIRKRCWRGSVAHVYGCMIHVLVQYLEVKDPNSF